MMFRDYMFLTFQFLLIINFSKGLDKITQNGDGDTDFQVYLLSLMNNYSSWLKESGFDPSPPISETAFVDANIFRDIYLQCDLSNVFLKGHSDTLNDVLVTASNLTAHVVTALRNVKMQPYEYHGDLNCSGAIKQLNFPELRNDLPFNGKGKFVVMIENSTEMIQIFNFGITEGDYKLELEHSWSEFIMLSSVKDSRISADWDERLIGSRYIGVVQDVFGELFQEQFAHTGVTINPAYRLLDDYLRGKLQGLDLTSIIAEENLPPPFSATPSPPTSPPTPTTRPTVPWTTPTTTTPSSGGVNLFTGTWVFFTQVVLMMYLTWC